MLLFCSEKNKKTLERNIFTELNDTRHINENMSKEVIPKLRYINKPDGINDDNISEINIDVLPNIR